MVDKHVDWQPIDTAPRDGEFVLLCDDNYDSAFLIAQWRKGEWQTKHSPLLGNYQSWAGATHWARLWPPGEIPPGVAK